MQRSDARTVPPPTCGRANRSALAGCGDRPPVKTLLAITDLTRMQSGRVCIAGHDREGNCIRPVLPPPGIPEHALKADGKAIIFPFAAVEYGEPDRTRPPQKEK